ncbi:MAG: glycosyltransferase [Rhizobiaceae bacterium]|nr:glycosyltransferase [Rhizobiaceae bacterium]MCV0407472.1 glycosyltransferase [Rhizobiaceae bacterium]
MRIAFYGSSLLSSYWNGAATYYRGILKALAHLGHEVVFYEPDAHGRQEHRDIEPPDWCRVVVYPATLDAVAAAAAEASSAEVVVKASGVGFQDAALFDHLLANARPEALTVFWDVDAPATLAELADDVDHPLHRQLARTRLVFTYGGGDPVVYGYKGFGVEHCFPIYNGLDPETHFPVPKQDGFSADLAFLGNRLPDREARVEEFFLSVAQAEPQRRFLLGGSGWDDKPLPSNMRCVGHVPTSDHNAFNCSPLAVLNVSRRDMAQTGFSPATRVFEAAGAGACIITDRWPGVDFFFDEGTEILVAGSGEEVRAILAGLTPEIAREIGDRAHERVLRCHTYRQRAMEVDGLLTEYFHHPVREAAE